MYSVSQNINPKEYKVQVAMNACYDILYDSPKNRIYFTIYGYWKNKECVSEFINDWTKALDIVKPGFTILTDMRTMITHPQELSNLHQESHTMVLDAMVTKVAHIMPTDKIAYLQVHSIHESTNLPSKNFQDVEEAEQWLNMVTAPSSN